MSTVELALWECITLIFGLFGSYLFGRYTAHDIIRPHARSALRSVLVLHRGIGRLADTIYRLNSEEQDRRFESLHAQVQD